MAEAALLAETHGRAGERYIIANEFIDNRRFFTMVAARTKRPPPPVIPYRAAFVFARIAEIFLKLARRNDFMVNTDAIYLSYVFRELDSGKARRELGWNPRPIEATVGDAIDWLLRESANRDGLSPAPALRR